MTITLDLNQFQAKDQNFFAEMLPYVSPAIRNIQRQGDKVMVELEERGLITTERTTVTTRDGRTLNGCLRYYILPIQMSIEQFYERQLHAADLALERQRAEQRMAALERKECASGC